MTTLPDFVIGVEATHTTVIEAEAPITVKITPAEISQPFLEILVPGKLISEIGPVPVFETLAVEVQKSTITVTVAPTLAPTIEVETKGSFLVEVGIPLIVVGTGGGETTPGTAIRYIGDEAPDTTDWNVDDLWLDTSTEL